MDWFRRILNFQRRRHKQRKNNVGVSMATDCGQSDGKAQHEHTLSHKVLQMMPLDVVRQIADIDASVLLRRVSETLHRVLFAPSAVFNRTSGSAVGNSAPGRARATVAATKAVAATRPAARRVGPPAARGARPTSRRPRPFTLP